MMVKNIETIPELIKELFSTIEKLQENFDSWSFTLDGNLLGDIGEVIACYLFDLSRLSKGTKIHDARTKENKKVQIKITQCKRVGLGMKKSNFEHLIVLKLDKQCNIEIVYNGNGSRIWENIGNTSKSISLTKLRILNKKVPSVERLPQIRNFP